MTFFNHCFFSIGLLTALLIPFSHVYAETSLNVSKTMTFGIASTDITCEPGPELAGFLARIQPSTGIHRPLFARAAYMEQGTERLFWLIADSLGYTPEIVARVKKQLSEKYNMEPWRILVQATHTHSAPSASRLSSCGEYDANYVETILLPGFFRAADDAKANAEPCQMVEVTGQCDINIDRRNKPTKHTEKRVPAIGWKRPDGSFKAVMLGYTMHPSSYVNGDISPDWPGAAAEAIHELFSKDTVPFVFQGACGNINYSKKNFPYEELEDCGRVIVRTVADLLKEAQPSTPYLAVQAQPINVQLDYLDMKGIEDFVGQMRQSLAGNAKGLKAVDIWEDWAKNYNIQKGPGFIEADIAAVLIGSRAFVTSPFETLSWMNPELAKHTTIECFAMGYTNGCYNYLPHDAAYDEGGYEPDTSCLWYRNFRIKRGELERLAENSAPLVDAAAKSAGLK
jgi:hypothetical protein